MIALIRDATPEQLADDGSVDGVPVRTLAQVEAALQARLAEVERLTAGTHRAAPNVKNGKACQVRRLSDGRLWAFKSVTEACAHVGCSHQNVRYMLSKTGSNVYHGFAWYFDGRRER